MMKHSLKAALLVSICLLPQMAFAQDAGKGDAGASVSSEAPTGPMGNEWWVGGKWQSGDSAKFGRYNGSPDGGAYMQGGFNMDYSNAWDKGAGHYFRATGDNLNFSSDRLMPNSSASVSFGQQGWWGVNARMDNITYVQSQTFHTFFTGGGGLALGTNQGISLAAVSAANPPTAADVTVSDIVNSQLIQMTVGTERNSVGAGFKYIPFKNWVFTTDVQHEQKHGTKENSLITGSSTSLQASTSSLFYFPEPVKYNTDRYTAMLAYNAKRLQANLSYTLSTFKDESNAFYLLDPFTTTGLPAAFRASSYSLPPDNSAHQFKGQLGYNITDTTRFVANLGYGWQFQDDAYAPSSLQTTGAVFPAGMPASFDGKVRTMNGSATLTSRPVKEFDLKASFTFDDRDNRSKVEHYTVSPLIDRATFNAFDRNAPYSFSSNTAKVEAAYRVMPSTKITVGDTYNFKTRTYTSANRTHENTLYGQVRSQLTDQVSGSLGASHAARAMNTPYNQCSGWDQLEEGTCYTGISNASRHNARYYSMASRSRNEYKGSVSYSPMDTLSMDMNGKYYTDAYPDTIYGITHDSVVTANPDISYAVNDDLNTHFFYSYERASYLLNAVSTQSGTAAVAPFTATPFYWSRETTSIAQTLGASADWKYSDKLKFNLGYLYQRGTIGFEMDGSGYCALAACGGASSPWNYNIVQLPDSRSRLHSGSISGEYALMDDMTLTFGYGIERYTAHDYLYDLSASDPAHTNVALPGDGNPSYLIHTVGAGLHVKW